MIKDKNDILRAKTYKDIFSSDKKIAKTEFREYCKLYHPDVDDSAEAAKLFNIIKQLYDGNMIKSVEHQVTNETFVFKDEKTLKGFEISNPVIIDNGICTVYHTATKVVLLYHESYKKFYDNYIKNVESLQYKDKNMEKEFSRLFPHIVKHFITTEGQLCILLNKTPDVINLGRIVKAYEINGDKFPEKQAAWIMNRLYNIACYNNFYHKALNGFTLDNIWVSPEMHSVLLFNGWEYMMDIGDAMIGCPKGVYKVLPIKVRDTKKSSMITDLESIKSIGRKLFSGHDDLTYINKFLQNGVSSDIPIDEWELYGNAIKKQFGKREFVVWEDVPYNNKK